MAITAASNDLQLLSQKEIDAFVADWFCKLDQHAPVELLIPMLVEQGLSFQLPEGVLTTIQEFQQWYVGGDYFPGVINLFFDETHTVSQIKFSLQNNLVLLNIVVNWQARRWSPPAPRSEWIGFDAYQRWEMIRSSLTGQPVLRHYIVDELIPMPGSPLI